MRLLMISSDTGPPSGRHGPFWHTLRGLHDYWDGIDVICPPVSEPAEPVLFGNVRFHPLPRRPTPSPFRILREGLRVCGEARPDLIVAHSYGLPRLALGGLLLARRTGVPLVIEVHHVDGYPRPSDIRDRIRRVAQFLFLRYAARHARAFRVVNTVELVPLLTGLGVPAERILPLYAIYLDRAIFQPEPRETKRYDMVFVGRLVPNKGLPILLDAFEAIRRRRPGASFLIVGRGPLEDWLHRELARRGADRVRHVPWVPETADLAQLYRQSRVVVCASDAEGGPRFVVEGMACGLPPVSVPVGLMREIIRDGENGHLLRSWAPDELAGEVLGLLEDDDHYRRCAASSIETAARFDYADTIRAYALGYRELAA